MIFISYKKDIRDLINRLDKLMELPEWASVIVKKCLVDQGCRITIYKVLELLKI
jgi:hypothetical protein